MTSAPWLFVLLPKLCINVQMIFALLNNWMLLYVDMRQNHQVGQMFCLWTPTAKPIPPGSMVPMVAPLLIVPPTPRSVPATPRRGRSRSKTPIPARSRQGALPPLPEHPEPQLMEPPGPGAAEPSVLPAQEPPALPSEPSGLPPGQSFMDPSSVTEPHALPSEPSALPPRQPPRHMRERTASSATGSISAIPRGSQDLGATASLQRHLEQAMDDTDLSS